MSDGGKVEKPQPSRPPAPKQAAPVQQAPGEAREAGRGGYQAMMAQRRAAMDKVTYRATGGAEGTPPAGDIAAERKQVVGAAVERISRKKSGEGVAGAQIPKTSGSPLPSDLREKMEPKLGADLSSARIHTGGESATAAAGFGARAFTHGNDVHFNAGEFKPGTKDGDQLIAHELTHVVQGAKSGVQRKAEPESGGGEATAEGGDGAKDGSEKGGEAAQVSQPGDPAEQEADAVSEKVAGDLHGPKKGKGGKGGKGDDQKGAEAKDPEAAGEGGAEGEAGPQAKEQAPAIAAKLLPGVIVNRAVTPVGGGVPSRPRPPEGPNMQPIMGKLTQAIAMFTGWAQRPADPTNLVAQQILRTLETCREQAQSIMEGQNRGLPDSQLRPRRAALATSLQSIKTADPKYHLISISEMSVTVSNARKQMPVVPIPGFTMLNPANRSEYERQLREQTDGMNAMVADQWRTNRDKYKDEGRSSKGSQMQKKFQKRNGNQANTAAPHNPDQGPGGFPDPTGKPASLEVNNHIGSQWPTRLPLIDVAVNALDPAERITTQMNVQLTVA